MFVALRSRYVVSMHLEAHQKFSSLLLECWGSFDKMTNEQVDVRVHNDEVQLKTNSKSKRFYGDATGGMAKRFEGARSGHVRPIGSNMENF